MRDFLKNSSKLLVFSILIGLIFFFIGIIHFLDLPEYNIEYYYDLIERSWYNITYQALFAFAFFFTFLGIFLYFFLLEENGKNILRKFNLFFIFILILGGLTIIYSLITPHFIQKIDPRDTEFDYFIIGTFLVILAYTIFIFTVKDPKKLWDFKILFGFWVLFGLLLEIFSFIVYSSLLTSIGIDKSFWRVLLIYGCLILYIGFIPLIYVSSSDFKLVPLHLQWFWIMGGLLGLGVYLAPTLALNGILFPMTIFQSIRYFHFLFFGSILMIVSLALLVITNNKFLKKFGLIWLLVLLAGIFQIIIAGILILSTSYLVEIPIDFIAVDLGFGPTIIGMTWDVFFINGAITTLVSIILLIPSLIRKAQTESLV